MRQPLRLLLPLCLLLCACERKVQESPRQTSGGSSGAQGASGSGPILLGSVGSLTGPEATFGVTVRDGIALAVEEANAQGGVKGRPLAVRFYDSQGKPEESSAAVTRLISQDHVSVILGEVSSSNSLVIADAAQAAHVPMVTPAATHPDVTKKGDYIFRVCFIDPFQGEVMAKFARENLKLSRVAILQDDKNAYSLGLARVFDEAFRRLGGEVVARASYQKGDTDFRAPLTQLRKARPEALYVPGFYSEVGVIARQARELGFTEPLLGGDGWESDHLLELAGNALEGSYYSAHYALDNPAPALQRFVAAYRKRYGVVPEAGAALGYDAARVAIAALSRAPSLDGPAVRDALASTRNFVGAAGTLSLDANRNAVKPAVILEVEGTRRRFVTTVAP
ncbi:ABC transporter substrate-binding protein [Aggregicoccus sp. 17bor-14]|uniref:ABC transporter substrate-binding protein n=1 Tax=Myxococcaceae TaxID=31 RepID=UPI00129C1392|nr:MULTISPECIES: ABC transporter substrate-binding protein [Myxococcaceae]MBF5045132.1 ABC transporter substrate-binding protein [Simulacricoccus sp. 17bor-14]MRI90874.1 ABC transporter substrate-binding protein [Aggregicoccus sp. 17bor-14]